jgi:hypothetical protein
VIDSGSQNIIPNVPLHCPNEISACTPRASPLEIPGFNAVFVKMGEYLNFGSIPSLE